MSIFFVASQRGGAGASTVAAHIAALTAHYEVDTLFVALEDAWQLELFFSAAQGRGRVRAGDLGDLWGAAAQAEERLHVAALKGVEAHRALEAVDAADASRSRGVVIVDMGVQSFENLAWLGSRGRVLNVLRADAASVISVSLDQADGGEPGVANIAFCINQFDPRLQVCRDVEVILSGKLGEAYLGRISADAAIAEAAADGLVLSPARRGASQALRDLAAVTEKLLDAAGVSLTDDTPILPASTFMPSRGLTRL